MPGIHASSSDEATGSGWAGLVPDWALTMVTAFAVVATCCHGPAQPGPEKMSWASPDVATSKAAALIGVPPVQDATSAPSTADAMVL